MDTHHAHGLYDLHESTTENEKKMAKLRGKPVKRTFTVTHTQSGLKLQSGSERAMKKLARHMHANAGDAGHAAQFGKMPDVSATKLMQAAFNSHVK